MSKINYTTELKKNVDSLIARAGVSLGKAESHVQIAAVAVLLHAYQHGDYSKAGVLVSTVTDNGGLASSLVKWFVKFGGLTGDDKGFTGWQGADYIKANFDEAKATMWSKYKPANPYAGLNLKVEMLKLVNRAMDAQKKAIKNPDLADKVVVDNDLLLALKALAA